MKRLLPVLLDYEVGLEPIARSFLQSIELFIAIRLQLKYISEINANLALSSVSEYSCIQLFNFQIILLFEN